jgi:hypothetical protein
MVILVDDERCHPPFVYLLACGSHHRQMVEVQSFRRCTHLLGFRAICIAETAMPRGESMLLAFDDGDAARSLDTGVSTCNPSLFLQDLFHLLAGQVRRWGKPADQLLLAIQVPQMLREGCDLRLIDDRLRMLVLPLAYLLPGYPWPNFSQDDLWPIR